MSTTARVTTTSTVLPPGSFITYLPSEKVAPIACGATLTPEAFGDDTTAKLSGPLGCTSGSWGLKITASGKTLDLNKFNIFRDAGFITAGSVGILVSNATGVTINGGGTNTGNGIDLFDYCVKDEGQSKKLSINTLRCFKARSAGIDIASKKAQDHRRQGRPRGRHRHHDCRTARGCRYPDTRGRGLHQEQQGLEGRHRRNLGFWIGRRR